MQKVWAIGTACAVLLAARGAHASCSVAASPTTPCVSHNGSAYTVDTGNGFVAQPTLFADPNVQLRFEIDSNCAFCSGHPLYISTNANGAGLGFVTGGITTGSFTYTPTATDLANGIYYQCQIHFNMGGPILPFVDGGAADAGADAADDAADGAPDASTPDASAKDASVDDATVPDAATDAKIDAPTDARADVAVDAEPDAGTTSTEAGGCSCSIDQASSPWGSAVAGLLGLALFARRRKRQSYE
ncbi:MAG TPA: MYXO-CTERM sorting domain-containing protein [Polyangiaceae bacterium]|jgi:MYXO-CTERM domain-containing protein